MMRSAEQTREQACGSDPNPKEGPVGKATITGARWNFSPTIAIGGLKSGRQQRPAYIARSFAMSLGTVLIILLILILLGVIPRWGYSSSWGYGPSGIVGTVLVIVIILLLLGRI
jgi:hypothetical protein